MGASVIPLGSLKPGGVTVGGKPLAGVGRVSSYEEVEVFLAPRLRRLLAEAARHAADGPAGAGAWEEIRLRAGRPLMVVHRGGDFFVGPDGRPVAEARLAYTVEAAEVRQTLELMSGSSLYAWENELRQGFLTLPGGHRVGICGRAVFRDGRLFTLKEIGSLNLRIAREAPGAADRVLPWLIDAGGLPHNTLVFSSPGAGKTTLLRDMARQISCGRPDLGLPGLRVGVADERSELAGAWQGVPRMDLGPRTDVLDGCPKALAITMLLRSMNPQVIASDEIGRSEDAAAIREALRCGVRVLATAHAGSAGELAARPTLRGLLAGAAFTRLVRLGRRERAGAVEEVWDWRERRRLHPEPEAGGRPSLSTGRLRTG